MMVNLYILEPSSCEIGDHVTAHWIWVLNDLSVTVSCGPYSLSPLDKSSMLFPMWKKKGLS